MNLSRDIRPLTDFKRNSVEFLAQLKGGIQEQVPIWCRQSRGVVLGPIV